MVRFVSIISKLVQDRSKTWEWILAPGLTVLIICVRLFFAMFLIVSIEGCIKSSIRKTGENQKENSIKTLQSMAEITNYIKSADLIIFDIDHTILEATTPYCHSNWFYDLYEEALANGVREESAVDALLPPWEEAQKTCEVKAVEDFIPSLIKDIQSSNKKVMALTSRSKDIAAITIGQLKSLGIDFSTSAPAQADFSLKMAREVVSNSGVVFATDYLSKGDVLKEYLKHTKFNPRRILFVDDSKRNLVSVSDVLAKDAITVVSFHYPVVKRELPHWDKKQARLEWEKRHGKIVYSSSKAE